MGSRGKSGVRFRLHQSLANQRVKSPKLTIFGLKLIVLTPPIIENLGVLGGKVVLDFDLGTKKQIFSFF